MPIPLNPGFMSTILPGTQLYLPAYTNHFKRTTTSLPYYQTQPYLPVYTNLFTITNTFYTILPDTTVSLAYRNHLTITSICLPYYQRHSYTYLPIATTLQQHPPVYHTTRDTTVFTCLQQPPENNIHLSTILPETRLYCLAYSNHLTITSTCLTQIYLPVYRKHIIITSTCLPYYQIHNCIYLPTATTLK